MSDVLIGAGDDFNILARGTVSVVSENSSYPRTKLYDGRSSMLYKAASAVADLRVSVDGDLLRGAGSFEGGVGFLTSISSGAGSPPAEEGAIVDSGSKALKLTTGASGQSGGYVEIWARAGERINFKGRLRGDGTRVARFRIYIPKTGQYLKSDNTLDTPGAAAVDYATRSTATYGDITAGGNPASFTMPSFASLRAPSAKIRLIFLCTETSVGAAYFDGVYIWPSWDFASAHALANWGPVTPKLQSSDDGSSWTTRGTGSLVQPQSTWIKLAATRDERYAGLLLEGTNHEALECAEITVGKVLALASHPNMGYEIGHLVDVVESQSPYGEDYVRPVTRYVRRTFGLRFAHASDGELVEIRDEVFARCLGPTNPVVVVPDTDKPECILGRINRSFKVARTFIEYYSDDDMPVAEEPFPPERS